MGYIVYSPYEGEHDIRQGGKQCNGRGTRNRGISWVRRVENQIDDFVQNCRIMRAEEEEIQESSTDGRHEE